MQGFKKEASGMKTFEPPWVESSSHSIVVLFQLWHVQADGDIRHVSGSRTPQFLQRASESPLPAPANQHPKDSAELDTLPPCAQSSGALCKEIMSSDGCSLCHIYGNETCYSFCQWRGNDLNCPSCPWIYANRLLPTSPRNLYIYRPRPILM